MNQDDEIQAFRAELTALRERLLALEETAAKQMMLQEQLGKLIETISRSLSERLLRIEGRLGSFFGMRF